MVDNQAILTAILGVVLAACEAVVPSLPPPASPPPSVSPTAAPDAAFSTSLASPTATSSPVSPSPTATALSTPGTSPGLEPPMPTGVTFHQQYRLSDDQQFADVTQTVRWQTPQSDRFQIRVYGVTKCLAEPEDPPPDSSGPCLVVHTALPASLREILAVAPSSDGTASWTWTEGAGCDVGLPYDPARPAYYAVVLAAYDGDVEHSIFAIAEAGMWWRPGLNDTVC
jgi:hypothetical protein